MKFRAIGDSSPSNTLLKQEGFQLAEASFRDEWGYDHSFYGKITYVLTESCASEVAAPRPFPVKGGTRCQKGSPRMKREGE